MTIDLNPYTQGLVHPEQERTEHFCGYFNESYAKNNIHWKTKRIGSISINEKGNPYPSEMKDALRPLPVFVLRAEIIAHFNRALGK